MPVKRSVLSDHIVSMLRQHLMTDHRRFGAAFPNRVLTGEGPSREAMLTGR